MQRFYSICWLILAIQGIGCSTSGAKIGGKKQSEIPLVAETFIQAWSNRYPDFGTSMGLTEHDSRCTILKNDMETYDMILTRRWIVKINHELAREISEERKIELRKFREILEQDDRWVESRQNEKVIPFLPATTLLRGSLEPLLAERNPEVKMQKQKDAWIRFRQCVEGQEVFAPLLDAAEDRIRHYEKQFGKKGKYPLQKEIEDYLRESPKNVEFIKDQFRESNTGASSKEISEVIGKFQLQVSAYDSFVRSGLLPKARKGDVKVAPAKDKSIALPLQRLGKCSAPECLNFSQLW